MCRLLSLTLDSVGRTGFYFESLRCLSTNAAFQIFICKISWTPAIFLSIIRYSQLCVLAKITIKHSEVCGFCVLCVQGPGSVSVLSRCSIVPVMLQFHLPQHARGKSRTTHSTSEKELNVFKYCRTENVNWIAYMNL